MQMVAGTRSRAHGTLRFLISPRPRGGILHRSVAEYNWGLTAEGGPDWWLGDAVHDGDVFRTATYGGSNAPAVRLPSANGKFEPHRGGFPKR